MGRQNTGDINCRGPIGATNNTDCRRFLNGKVEPTQRGQTDRSEKRGKYTELGGSPEPELEKSLRDKLENGLNPLAENK